MENNGGMISIYRGKLVIHPTLSGNPTSSNLVANDEQPGKRNDEFGLQNIFVHTSMPQNLTWVRQLYFPSEGRCAWFEPTNLGSNGKHANHYTTEATYR
jgi:hypothetical protein